MRTRIMLVPALAFAALASLAAAQPATPQDPALLNSLDSLKRVITRRILSDAEKKEIRACDREKTLFLQKYAKPGCQSIDIIAVRKTLFPPARKVHPFYFSPLKTILRGFRQTIAWVV